MLIIAPVRSRILHEILESRLRACQTGSIWLLAVCKESAELQSRNPHWQKLSPRMQSTAQVRFLARQYGLLNSLEGGYIVLRGLPFSDLDATVSRGLERRSRFDNHRADGRTMASTSIMSCLGLILLLLTSHVFNTEALLQQMETHATFSSPLSKVFIVYMGGVSDTTTNAHIDVHMSILSDVLGSAEAARSSMLYSYTSAFNGFAAVFADSHADLLRGRQEVVSVFPDTTRHVHTSYSWEFLGLDSNQGFWPSSGLGNGTIIGMIDTGIWPESLSFADDGFDSVPSTWKGECVKDDQFGPENCNKKLIGGKFFSKGYEAKHGPIVAPELRSPRDDEGHGTHTASTASGRQVSNASFDGVGNGTISGGAPASRVAAYRVCWKKGCTDTDMLAAFNEAISDGVDLISISIGGSASDYSTDSIAIGSYHAMEKGIVVSASAGNSGPSPGSVENVAPWIFTVAASTLDRQFISPISMGGSISFNGVGINTWRLNETSYPLVNGADIALSSGNASDAAYCRDGSIDKKKAKGAILLCLEDNIVNATDLSVLKSTAAGTIIIQKDEIVQWSLVVPATHVFPAQGDEIELFINSTQNPTAYFPQSETVLHQIEAPLTPFFSSVGPNPITPGILKPDISAPGVDIIASWSAIGNPSESPGDTRLTPYNIISGTSMACPHVTGAAALIKSSHPDWSPAAIKSALMTTATVFNATINQYNNSRELSTGSGLINPSKASDPGLIYDLKSSDYFNFLCSVNYTTQQVQQISGNKNNSCPTETPSTIDLNYPSIMVAVNSSVTTTRTVTNVGPSSGNATYTVSVESPTGMNVTVTPTTLTFSGLNVEESFTVSISVDSTVVDFLFGSITWSDSNWHSVRIPVGYAPK